ESDDFKTTRTIQSREDESEPNPKSSAQLKREGSWESVLAELREDFVDCHSLAALSQLRATYREKAIANGWTRAWLEALKNEFDVMEDAIKQVEMAGAM